jgi:hypothetical protein
MVRPAHRLGLKEVSARTDLQDALNRVPLFTALGLLVVGDGDVLLPRGLLSGNHFGAAYALAVGAAMEAAGAVRLMLNADLTRWAPVTGHVDLRFIRPAFEDVRAHAEAVDLNVCLARLESHGGAQCKVEVRARVGPRHCAYGEIEYHLLPWGSLPGAAKSPARRR